MRLWFKMMAEVVVTVVVVKVVVKVVAKVLRWWWFRVVLVKVVFVVTNIWLRLSGGGGCVS